MLNFSQIRDKLGGVTPRAILCPIAQKLSRHIWAGIFSRLSDKVARTIAATNFSRFAQKLVATNCATYFLYSRTQNSRHFKRSLISRSDHRNKWPLIPALISVTGHRNCGPLFVLTISRRTSEKQGVHIGRHYFSPRIDKLAATINPRYFSRIRHKLAGIRAGANFCVFSRKLGAI